MIAPTGEVIHAGRQHTDARPGVRLGRALVGAETDRNSLHFDFPNGVFRASERGFECLNAEHCTDFGSTGYPILGMEASGHPP